MTDKPPSRALSAKLCFAFYSMSHAFNRAYRQLLDPLGLTYPQYIVLVVLWERDGLTVKEIGESTFLDSGTLTPLLKRLESSGLIRRVRDARDERQVRISLTEAGHALQDKARDIPRILGCMLGLSDEEIRAFSSQVTDLRGKLHASIPAFAKS